MCTSFMKSIKTRVNEYLESQKQHYDDNEIEENLKILKNMKEDLSDIDTLNKILVLRYVDDNELYYALNSINND